MPTEAQFLKKLYATAFSFVKQRLGSFDPSELGFYSKTLSKFTERLVEAPETVTAKKEFVRGLQKELRNAQKFPNSKPLMYLQQVTDLHLTPFGSTVMGTGIRDGDLDISLNGVYHYRKGTKGKVFLDAKTSKAIQGCLLVDLKRFLQFRQRLQYAAPAIVLSRARIPILKFTERRHGLRCDVSIGNDAGVLRSQVLSEIMKADPRIRMLVLLLKKWARCHSLNDASKGSFGSYALTVAVLACCVERGVLPSLMDLIPSLSGARPSDVDRHCEKIERVMADRLSATQNKESMLELFLSCFVFLSLYVTREVMYEGQVPRIAVCCRKGTMVDLPEALGRGIGVTIQDPFHPESNCGKTVSNRMLVKASFTMQEHLAEISAFLVCPELERRARWQSLFHSLFRVTLKFKQQPQPTPKMTQMRSDALRRSELLLVYDQLIDRYFHPEGHQRLFRVEKSAHAQWFLRRLEAQWMQHKEKNSDPDEADEADTPSLFKIKDSPVAGAVA